MFSQFSYISLLFAKLVKTLNWGFFKKYPQRCLKSITIIRVVPEMELEKESSFRARELHNTIDTIYHS